MKEYRVNHDTIVKGAPRSKGDVVKLSEDDAKAYKAAGLIEEVKEDKKAAAADKKASEEAAKIDTSSDKRVQK